VIGRARSRMIGERKKTEDARSPPDHQRFRSLEQDAFARETVEKAVKAKENGLFKTEIVSVDGIDADEGPSIWTAEEYASFKP